MAVARDVFTAGGRSAAGATSLAWNHTCAVGATLLVVCGYCDDGSALTVGTYGIGTLTLEEQNQGGPTVGYFYILNPSSGTNLVTIHRAGVTSIMRGWSTSYTATSTSAFPDAHKIQFAASGGLIVSTTTVATNTFVAGGVWNNSGGVTNATNTTFVGSGDGGSSSNPVLGYYENALNPFASAGSTPSLGWSDTASNEYIGFIYSIAPSAGTTTTLPNRKLLGVGI